MLVLAFWLFFRYYTFLNAPISNSVFFFAFICHCSWRFVFYFWPIWLSIWPLLGLGHYKFLNVLFLRVNVLVFVWHWKFVFEILVETFTFLRLIVSKLIGKEHQRRKRFHSPVWLPAYSLSHSFKTQYLQIRNSSWGGRLIYFGLTEFYENSIQRWFLRFRDPINSDKYQKTQTGLADSLISIWMP